MGIFTTNNIIKSEYIDKGVDYYNKLPPTMGNNETKGNNSIRFTKIGNR